MPPNLESFIAQQVNLSEAWFSAYIHWLYFGETLGLLITIGSITVASAPSFLVRCIDMKTLAYLVAALSGINVFLDPIGKAHSYDQAATQMQIALYELQTPNELSNDQIKDRIERLRIARNSGYQITREKIVEVHEPQSVDTSIPK